MNRLYFIWHISKSQLHLILVYCEKTVLNEKRDVWLREFKKKKKKAHVEMWKEVK